VPLDLRFAIERWAWDALSPQPLPRPAAESSPRGSRPSGVAEEPPPG